MDREYYWEMRDVYEKSGFDTLIEYLSNTIDQNISSQSDVEGLAQSFFEVIAHANCEGYSPWDDFNYSVGVLFEKLHNEYPNSEILTKYFSGVCSKLKDNGIDYFEVKNSKKTKKIMSNEERDKLAYMLEAFLIPVISSLTKRLQEEGFKCLYDRETNDRFDCIDFEIGNDIYKKDPYFVDEFGESHLDLETLMKLDRKRFSLFYFFEGDWGGIRSGNKPIELTLDFGGNTISYEYYDVEEIVDRGSVMIEANFLAFVEVCTNCTIVRLNNEKQKRRRERIPESVRHAVWRRDEGRCVECGSKENLEYDHIIPFSQGGSNTERNLQLLCESCNRKKSAKI